MQVKLIALVSGITFGTTSVYGMDSQDPLPLYLEGLTSAQEWVAIEKAREKAAQLPTRSQPNKTNKRNHKGGYKKNRCKSPGN